MAENRSKRRMAIRATMIDMHVKLQPRLFHALI